MPVTKSARKALRVSLRRQVINTQVRSRMKTAVAHFLENPSMELMSAAYAAIDRSVKNHLLHRNTAARRKSLLARRLGAATQK